MKKIYTILSIFFITNLVLAQASVEIIAEDDGINYAGQTVEITGNTFEVNKMFTLKNTGTTNTFYFSRTVTSRSGSTVSVQLCDEMICYNTDGFPGGEPNVYWIGPVKTYQPGNESIFKPQISTSQDGSAEVVYYILDENQDKLDSLTVVFTSTASIKDYAKSTFKIFPNPMQDVVTINGDAIKNGGTVVFTDALGKEVKRKVLNSGTSSVNVAELRRGVYFVNVYNKQGDKSAVQRVIKQ